MDAFISMTVETAGLTASRRLSILVEIMNLMEAIELFVKDNSLALEEY